MADETKGSSGSGDVGDLGIRISALGEQSTIDALSRVDSAAAKTNERVEASARAAVDATARVVEQDVEAAIRAFASMDTLRRRESGLPASGNLASAMGAPINPPIFKNINVAADAKEERAARAAVNREIQEEIRLLGVMLRVSDIGSRQQVQELRQNTIAQREWLQSMGASQLQLARLDQSVSAFEKRVVVATASQRRAADQAARVAAQHRVMGVALDTTNGSLNRFGRSSLTVLNAVSFGFAQLEATGVASFRSVASASASFLAIFGPYGAVASMLLTVGLVFADFFTRRKKELEELAQKAIEETRRAVREIELATRTGDRDALAKRAKNLFQGTNAADGAGVVDLQQQAKDLQNEIDNRQADLTRFADKMSIDQRQALAREIATLKTTRAKVVVDLAKVEDEIKNLMIKTLNAPIARDDARDPIKTSVEAIKKNSKEIDNQIAALKTLAELRQVDVRALRVAAELYARLTAHSKEQGLSLEEQAKTLDRLNTLKKTGLVLELPKIEQARSIDLSTPKTLGPFSIPSPTLQFSGLDAEIKRALDETFSKLGSDALFGATSRAALERIIEAVALHPEIVIDPSFVLKSEGLAKAAEAVDQQFKSLGTDLVGVISGALGAAFSGGDAGKVVLQGLGSIFMQMGEALLVFGAQMVGLLPAFSNPFTSGPAALASGAVLVALGAALGGIATGKGKGSSSSRNTGSASSSQEDLYRFFVTDPRVVGNMQQRGAGLATLAGASNGPMLQVIGINTPQGQRLIGESNSGFKRRGGS